MARNYIQPGRVLTVSPPTGGALSGAPVLIGMLLGVAQHDSAAGQDLEIPTEEVVELPKAALDTLTRVMAVEVGPQGIRVNSVEPAATLAPMAVEAWSDSAKSRPEPRADGPLRRARGGGLGHPLPPRHRRRDGARHQPLHRRRL